MYDLHDPHKTPEPILVLSGLTYLVPAWIALQKNRSYDFATFTFLTFTTTGFHSTRSELLFALDCIAILNFLGRSLYMSVNADTYTRSIYGLIRRLQPDFLFRRTTIQDHVLSSRLEYSNVLPFLNASFHCVFGLCLNDAGVSKWHIHTLKKSPLSALF